MGWDHELKEFDSCYSNVRRQLDELLADVVDGWKGDPDPKETRREELAKTICNLLEQEAEKEKKLSEAGMRRFVGELRNTFQSMITTQRDNRSSDNISYDSVIRCIRTKKPAKEKREGT
ncbi:hypothetical protein J3459_012046 [Metarhizium acridum]|uniref:uncharacterized protein n=1 Tax=Metarhizium acridum TaxID=92637 RepID=UPI001C6CEDA8|nr:hypothetical protein J3458_021757 [Metarhizium acridum]KAG8418778.1 hypothetical protein J3459_012046 [Metarhizium acridum]